MHESTRSRRAGQRLLALGAAVAMGMTLLPAAGYASSDEPTSTWSQAGGANSNARQATVAGPHDPGLAWHRNFQAIRSEAAPDGYRFIEPGTRHWLQEPLLTPDGGNLLVRAHNREHDGPSQTTVRLLSVDLDDGSIDWEVPGVTSACQQAIDSRGRVWAQHFHPDTQNVLRAYDADTGERVTHIQHSSENVPACFNSVLEVGGAGDSERLVVFRSTGVREGIMRVYDVSSDQPTLAWAIAVDEGDVDATDPFGPIDRAPFDTFMSRGPAVSRIVAFTDDSMILGGHTGEGESSRAGLYELSLEDGRVLNRSELPRFTEVDDEVVAGGDTLATDLAIAHLVVAGDQLLAGMRIAQEPSSSRPHDPVGYIAAFDLSDGLAEEATWLTTSPAGPSRYGPQTMALGDGEVVVQLRYGFEALSLTDGSRRDLATTLEHETSTHGNLLTDADGSIFAKTAIDGRGIGMLDTDGEVVWHTDRERIREAAQLGGEQPFEQHTLRVGPITSDGHLVVRGRDALAVIDASGGLAIEEPEEPTEPEPDPTPAPTFPDVAPGDVHADNISELAARGITTGYDDGTFRPGNPVLRDQMATFLTRWLGLTPLSEAQMHGTPFSDVDPSSVHARAINAVSDAGIAHGRGDGTYRPRDEVNRGQMASFLARAAGLDPVEPHAYSGTPFTDVGAEHPHAGSIYAVAEAGITLGRPDGTFRPESPVTRGQMASFLIRALEG